MNLPNLPRFPMRPEQEEPDQEIWQPSWKCYCCHDTGKVAPTLAVLVIQGYDDKRDRIPVCQMPGCRAGDQFMGQEFKGSVDMRLTTTVCQQLDAISREDWRNTLKAHQKRFFDLNCVTSLRERSRSSTEEMMAYQKHQAVLAEVNSINGVQEELEDV